MCVFIIYNTWIELSAEWPVILKRVGSSNIAKCGQREVGGAREAISSSPGNEWLEIKFSKGFSGKCYVQKRWGNYIRLKLNSLSYRREIFEMYNVFWQDQTCIKNEPVLGIEVSSRATSIHLKCRISSIASWSMHPKHWISTRILLLSWTACSKKTHVYAHPII